MIDDVSYIESYIKQRLPTITVFQNQTGNSDIEIDVQNVPGQPLNLIRLLLSRANAAAIRRDEDLAGRLIATLELALSEHSEEDEALLDLRGQL
jgi:hypothetical protein